MRRLGIGCVLAVFLLLVGFSLGNPSSAMNFLLTATLTSTGISVDLLNSTGDYRAYFLDVRDGLSIENVGDYGLSFIGMDTLRNRYGWTAEQISMTNLRNDVTLNNPIATNDVLVIPGGSEHLSDEEMRFIIDYVNAGGNLVIFAYSGYESEGMSLATADNMESFLYTAFGLYFGDEIVTDHISDPNVPFLPGFLSSDLNVGHSITRESTEEEDASLLFSLNLPIGISETPPHNVIVTPLAWSSEDSYTRTLDEVINQDYARERGDEGGPFVLMAAAENTNTGSRIVLFGSTDMGSNLFRQVRSENVVNIDIVFNAITWAAHFNDFYRDVPALVTAQADDIPTYEAHQIDVHQTATALAVTAMSNVIVTSSPYPFQLASGQVEFFANFGAPSAGCNWQGIGGRVRGLEGNEVAAGTLNIVVYSADNTFSQTIPVGSNRQYGSLSGWEVRTGDSVSESAYFVTLVTLSGTQASERIQVAFPGTCEANLAYLDLIRVR
jgi:hypothetical protein